MTDPYFTLTHLQFIVFKFVRAVGYRLSIVELVGTGFFLFFLFFFLRTFHVSTSLHFPVSFVMVHFLLSFSYSGAEVAHNLNTQH